MSDSIVSGDASDVTKQLKARLTYMALTGAGGQKAVNSMVPKSNGTYMLFRFGMKECGVCAAGTSPFVGNPTMTFQA